MWGYQFRYQLNLVADIVSEMDIGDGQTRVGLGIFSDKFHSAIPLNNTHDKQTLLNKIRSAPHIKGQTVISIGLQGLREQLGLGQNRPYAPRIGVFFTDGQSPTAFSAQAYNNASRAKNDGIFMFAVGIGQSTRESELLDISSDPKRYFLFRVESFASLGNIRSQLSGNMAKVSLYQDDKGTCGQNTKVDTVFVYDEFELGFYLRNSVRTFLNTVVDELRINPGNVRVGVVSKTQPGGNDIKLGDFVTREEFKVALERESGKQDIGELLREAREKYFETSAGHRIDAKKRLVLILTHPVPSNSAMRHKILEQLLRARYLNSIEVFIIRDGSDYDKGFLFQVASSPSHVLFTKVEDASEPFLTLFCKDRFPRFRHLDRRSQVFQDDPEKPEVIRDHSPTLTPVWCLYALTIAWTKHCA
ncbi:hypothetical protein EGW08_015442 [Elysia chlorotica]|uniref:VWFA domain-containing protein n=1 Tax=Elysia chlorotica TaxID=188477 RepID=A0A3S1B5U3_ELYCH|nr:hypothetical protein EGW08_015442 [Elysia chlorotica]